MSSERERRMFLMLGEMRGDIKSLLAVQNDLQPRVRLLEKSRNISIGMAAAIGAIVSPIVAYLTKHY